MNFDLTGYLNAKRIEINDALSSHINELPDGSRLCEAMRYSLLGNGKRLRPILCIASAEAVDVNVPHPSLLLHIACALEMVHTYSLIHDDLPAMDDDTLRRGRPTCHVQFDEATAILAGDALLTRAFEIIVTAVHDSDDPVTRPDMAVNIFSVLKCIAHASGYHGMIEGQMRDIESENQQIDLEALKEIHWHKTGALIEASVLSGAMTSGADERLRAHLSVYARNLGLAFQVTDDILNIEGDPEIMGKSTGTDASMHKSTFPGLIGLDASKKYAKSLVNTAVESLGVFENRARPLAAIAEYVLYRKR